MRPWRVKLGVAGFVLILIAPTFAAPFVLFPRAVELASPDGRLVVHNVDAAGSASQFVGTFHSLWLFEASTGRSRKICDYMGVAAVAWSGNDFLLVTEYMGKRTSRAFVFPVSGGQDPVMLDQPTLIRLVPVELRETLRGNAHVFVEASGLENETFQLRVWGYGQHDASGFRWGCKYALRDGAISCIERTGSH